MWIFKFKFNFRKSSNCLENVTYLLITGKRWLARMMGSDPDTFTQQDIDEAISYLLPSSLFAKDARPSLRHPYDLFPKAKESLVRKILLLTT